MQSYDVEHRLRQQWLRQLLSVHSYDNKQEIGLDLGETQSSLRFLRSGMFLC